MPRHERSPTPAHPRARSLLPAFLQRRTRQESGRPQEDMQGILLHGYKHMDAACFLLLRIVDPARCRRWLRETLPELTTAAEKNAEERSRQKTCLNLALTWSGLEALGLPAEALDTFPEELQEGMAGRADILGDTGESAPESWEFGGTTGEARQEQVHLLLMLYGLSEAELSPLLAAQRARLEAGGLKECACQQAARILDTQGHAREHFGFRDGISQPLIEGFMDPKQHAPTYEPPLKAGEFILGYENEYAEVPDPPSVPASLDTEGVLPEAGLAGWRELGRNGSYLVLRKLEQDVEGFQRFLGAHKELAVGDSEAHKEQWLAARLMGRWHDGAPLRPGEDTPPARPPAGPHGIDNTFGFHEEDPRGYGCPVGSHVRRANPRDALPPDPEMSRKVSRRHRILRRGITYSDARGRGLLFISLNANIARQFEFLQQTWLNNGKFGGRYDERDPFMAHGAGKLTLPREPLRRRVEGLQSFVHMRGGAYFFLPGLRALEFLAHLEPRTT
jgi:Dyp-type peroxidase family